MEETEETPSLFSHALKWALILGAIGIIISILLYVIDYTLMVQIKYALISLGLYLGLAIYSGIDYRKSIGGYIAYGKAFQHGFIVIALAGLISTIFTILLYTVIDTELPQKLIDATIDNTRAMVIQFGGNEEAADKAIEQGRADMEGRFTVAGLLKGYIFVLVFAAIISLISALIVRKNEPIEG